MALVLDATGGAPDTVTGVVGMERSQTCSLICGGRKGNSGDLVQLHSKKKALGCDFDG